MDEKEIVLRADKICKHFPGVQALSDVSFDIRKGEVHALVGENGAGKSTLIKIITGFHDKDSGTIEIDGMPVQFSNPHDSIEQGIACIYQELSIVPLIDVAKNLYLGNWPEKNNLVSRKALYANAREILKHIHLDVEPTELAGDLPIAQQQMVEIGRALTRNAKVIIMDEPTSSLTDKETETLFSLIRQLREEGVAVIYISHKLDEVLEISDRITVICDGRNITTVDANAVTRDKLIEYMLGRPLSNMFNKVETEIGETVLEVKNLCHEPYFRNVSFAAKAGEVVGFFGLVGAGRSEIMRAVFGIDKLDSGEIFIDGKPVTIRSSGDAVKNGLALVPENRKLEGLALDLSILENMTLPKLSDIKKGLFIDRRQRAGLTDEYIDSIRVKTPSPQQLAGNLSGGNQQKVVIAKWLMKDPRILILDEPTRGIDVGSKAEIYGLIGELAKKGVAVIVVSSEMNEIMGLCDRVITVYEGTISGELNVAETSQETVLSYALGGGQT